ncbi:MAG: cytochrome C biogenesis protein, partial [Candidatus Nanohaloarchaea archaeon]
MLPLYPGFISYLSSQLDSETDRRTYTLFGVSVVAGVLSFMTALGLIFTTLIQSSLSSVIGVVSPVAFALLGTAGLALLLDLDFRSYVPSGRSPE